MANEEIVEKLNKIEEVILTILGFMVQDKNREFQGQFLDGVEFVVEKEEGSCELNLGKHRLLFHASPLTLNFKALSKDVRVVDWIEETCRILKEDGDVGADRFIPGYKRIAKDEIEIFW